MICLILQWLSLDLRTVSFIAENVSISPVVSHFLLQMYRQDKTNILALFFSNSEVDLAKVHKYLRDSRW